MGGSTIVMMTGEEVQRTEREIFVELERLCASPGFIHAIAYICMRDNLIMYSGEMKADDMAKLYGRERLLRNEVNVLIGLVVKHEIDYSWPDEPTVERYVKRSHELLDEIHEAMLAPMRAVFRARVLDGGESFGSGAMLREAIFYGGESAFIFQYRDFARRRYCKDDPWTLANQGFTIGDAAAVVKALHFLRNEKSTNIFHALKKMPPTKLGYLAGNEFTAPELAARAAMPMEIVDRVLSVFAYPTDEQNAQFKAVDDHNKAAIFPLVRRGDCFILFNIFDLSEVLYQAPYFWMLKDKAYQPTASDHRGQFTEDFAEEQLVRVFGRENVKININLVRSKTIVGEIDVLVRFGGIAIVLQAKSKQLTAAARQGNETKLHEDFALAVQAACDQGYSCGQFLLDPTVALEDVSGNKIVVEGEITQIYVICLVADHYPALAAQVRQLLKFAPAEKIAPPFVMDVFNLDAMAEMLDTPLHFLSYLDRRTKYNDAIMSSHELTVLSYHLRQNLWFDGGHDAMLLGDEIGIDLELSMSVRREGVPGAWSPPGILTTMANTRLGNLVKQIERQPNAGMVALGFLILRMSERALIDISDYIDECLRRAVMDGRSKNLTVQLGHEREGLTIHISAGPQDEAEKNLLAYCAARKYAQRSDSWLGLLLAPLSGEIRFGVHVRSPWVQDGTMDEATKDMQPMRSTKSLPEPKKRQMSRMGPMPKVVTLNLGRNARCPCGSGKKSKRCCMM
jgi:hypothetical protein